MRRNADIGLILFLLIAMIPALIVLYVVIEDPQWLLPQRADPPRWSSRHK